MSLTPLATTIGPCQTSAGLVIWTLAPWLSQDLGWQVCASPLWAPGTQSAVNDQVRGGDNCDQGLTTGRLRAKDSTGVTLWRCYCHRSILQVRKLRLVGAWSLFLGHVATEWWRQDLDSRARFTAASCYALIRQMSREAPI